MRVLLISHCNLSGNSAMHVFSIAEQLVMLGHDVVMLIPDGLKTIKQHRKARFPVRLYEQALAGDLPFASAGKPEIVHAWSPREHVRKVTQSITYRHGCPYVLHMEDNEEQIVTDELKHLQFNDLIKLPTLYQDLITLPYRSHPTHYRDFAEGASGYTCLIERLMEFKPAHVPGLMFWPGFDSEFENLPTDARKKYGSKFGINCDEKIVFYSGNVHYSNVSDVRNLYLSVAALRARGRSVRLLRTGWSQTEIDVVKEHLADDAFIELGFVKREEIPRLLALSDLLVQPGRSDPFNDYRFPSKLPEYFVSGKPVILPACNIGNTLVDGQHVVKLFDGTFVELMSKMEQVLDDPALATLLGSQAREFAIEKLRWSSAARAISELYREILSGRDKESHRKRGLPSCLEKSALCVEPEKLDLSITPHPVKLIAFYLPQFYPIAENNRWWGKGFTEWTNVSRARPWMYGHRHPRLPSELGYYDLRVLETMHEQAKLAGEHGLTGFCFYVYWFDGRRLLEKPVDLWLKRGPDFPFCICWANENWNRRWDGSDSEILISQSYMPGFEERFIVDMLPILTDPRYIRVNGAPVVSIYRVDQLPDPVRNVQALRSAAARCGIQDLHIVMVQSFGLSDPRPYGCDAAVEFSPPHVNRLLIDPKVVGGVFDGFEGYLEDYVGVAAQSINAPATHYVRYRGCFPMWDNTARRGNRGHVFLNDSTKAYARWLRFLVEEAMVRRDQVEPYIFINAWNEWAEGAYLEPDEHYGRALLEVTKAALLHGVADYAQGGAPAERERDFSSSVSRLPS